MGGIGAMLRHKRVLAASLIGTAVEFYDFYIYATAASLVFGPLFFPASSPSAQLLAAYGSLALAFFARPLGTAVFGHYGDRDRKGRRAGEGWSGRVIHGGRGYIKKQNK